MFQRKVDEKFLKISQEHTLILDYIDRFEDVLAKDASTGALTDLMAILPSFEKDIEEHFLLEEQLLFPAALTCLKDLDIIDKVLLMQKEHGYFERDLEFICRLVENRPDDVKSIPDECHQRLQAYTKALKEHAHVEMEDIFAMMDKSRRCQKLIEGLTSPA